MKWYELYKKYGDGRTAEEGCPVAYSDLTQEQADELELKFARNKIDNLNEALYSMPWFKSKMKAWMVDIKFGNENLFSDKKCSGGNCSIKDAEEKIDLLTNDPEAFTEKTGGSLMKQVSDFLKSEGYTITDRGGSEYGGHIGCPCTDEEFERLTTLIHIRYKKAIESGMIFPKLAWFKPKLPGFYNDDAIEQWIEGR
jgi:hypothetical protein